MIVSTPISPKSDDLPADLPHRKPHADIYTVLLVVALAAILLATGLLWALMHVYDYKLKGAPGVVQHGPVPVFACHAARCERVLAS